MRVSDNNLPSSQPKKDVIQFAGGLDLVSKELFVAPGKLNFALNYEADLNGGYTSIEGYEKFDGRPRPSDAVYHILNITPSATISAGNTITGATSGATAVVIKVINASVQDYLVITKLVDDFEALENLQVGGATKATADSVQKLKSASTARLHAQYTNFAADEYRSDISLVPGSGSILGIIKLSGVKYAFRNNAGGTAAAIHKSSASGWVAVPLGFEMAFTSGSEEPAEGATITGGTSGATADVTRVMLESGSWDAGTAAGKFIFASQTGTFQSEAINISGSSDVATIAANSSAITLSPSGRYSMVISNFTGRVGFKRIYGADGVNRGFEFDGAVFCPIKTGMATDTPAHLIVHRKHLFFSFDGSSQNSGIGLPYQWTVISGASEIALGDTITAYKAQPGSEGNAALAIFSDNSINILYGTSNADWNLVDYREEVGAYPYTVQEFGMTLFQDDRGVNNLLTVQTQGNFQHNAITRDIQPFINAKKKLSTDSCVVRKKSQYRLFFSDKYALYITTNNRKIVGLMPVRFNHKVECCFSLEGSDGIEEMYFGSDDGFIYQMDKGTSFDGDRIEANIQLHRVHSGSPGTKKRYMDSVSELSGNGFHEFTFSYSLGYSSAKIADPVPQTRAVGLAGNSWDQSAVNWDQGQYEWDGESLSPARLKIKGRSENIILRFRSYSDYFSPITFASAQLRMKAGKSLK